MRIRWSNVPIPEPYLLALASGTLLHLVVPWPILPLSGASFYAALVLIVIGVTIAVWSVIAVRDNDVGRPPTLITRGPYAISRNPMYLAWTALSSGIGLIVNSAWMVMAIVAAWIYLHAVSIPREEEFLRRHFGAEYEAYRKRVRRYL